jgi:succinate-semialdehyde dehydrogenase/glutarate-semialdehyde dehydrogenase
MNDLIEDAVARGARVLCGGNPRPDLGSNFFEPTVVTDVDSTMNLFQEETFGPILAIHTVKDAEEAIRHANDSPFALAASVWTTDAKKGQSIAGQIRAGAVMVNDAISYFAIAEAPHGGCGASGWGRTHGRAGILEMVQPKYIDVDRLPRREKPWWYRYGSELERAADAFLRFQFSPGLGTKFSNVRSALKTFFRDHGL